MTGRRPGWRHLGATLAGAAAMITVITITSRVLGFARWMVQARTVGYGDVGNAYTSANTLPNVLFEVAAGGALAGALIPLLAGPIARRLEGEVNRIASAMLTWALVGLVPLAALVIALARPLAGFFLDPGADAAQQDLTTYFLRVFAVQIPLYGVGVVLAGVLQARKRFFWPAFAPVLSTLTVMAAYLMFAATAAGSTDDAARLPVSAAAWLAWGTTAGVAAMSLPLLVPAMRGGLRLRPTLRLPAGVARRALRLAGAGVAALLAQQLTVLVMVWLANNRGGTGTWPVFQYTQAVYLLPYAVLAVPLATSAFPRLAERVAEDDRAGFASLSAVTTRGVVLLGGLGAAVLISAAGAVMLVFQNVGGAGDPALMSGMAPALAAMAPGLVGFALLFHVSRVLYALERARVAVVAATAGWTGVIVAAVAACRILVPEGQDGPATLLGLGIGSSVGMLLGGAVAVLGLRRIAGAAAADGLLRTCATVLVGAGAGAVLGRVLADATVAVLAGGHAQPGIGAAIAAGIVGAVACTGVVALAVWLGDRRVVRAVLSGDPRTVEVG